MAQSLLARLARVWITVAYAVVLIGVAATLSALGPSAHDRVIRHASTNLHNLSHGHLGTLLDSAFVIDGGPIYTWLPGLVCLLGLCELLWRSGRLVLTFAVGHVGATLLVATGLTAAVQMSWVAASSVSRATDVGMSYGAAAVLGSLTAAIPRGWRPMWIGWWLAVGVTVVAIGRDFTDTGHVVALILGMVVATRFGQPTGWTPSRVVLLCVAAAFGYLMLASTAQMLAVAAVSGLVGASLGALAAHRHRNSSVEASIASTPTIHPAATIIGHANSA